MNLIKVTIPGTLSDGFDYKLDKNTAIELGARVLVPFRKKKKIGIVTALNLAPKENIKYKSVESILDPFSVLNGDVLSFLNFISNYYHAPLSEVLKLALPKDVRLGKPLDYPRVTSYQIKRDKTPELKGKKQQLLYDCLEQHDEPLSVKEIKDLGFEAAQLKALQEKGLLEENTREEPFYDLSDTHHAITLTEAQMSVVEEVKNAFFEFQPFLLEGVTGSGKTEVYLDLASSVVKRGKQVLILIPEIGLTPQFYNRVQERIAAPTLLVHSSVSEKERLLGYVACLKSDVSVVVGTRTALFLPLDNLGLIVIDEEHDLSFKQQEGVRYSARDMAVWRARQQNIPIVLGSATPSLESLNNVNNQKYKKLRLSKKALSQTPLYFKIIDIRTKRLQAGLSQEVLKTIGEHVNRKEQVLVFINRRGYAPIYLCHQCGKSKGCLNCSTNLILHQHEGKLSCHHCGYKERLTPYCNHCKQQSMIPLGVGTEQVSLFLQEQFKEHLVLRIDRDSIKNKKAFDDALDKINKGQADILVGTQMLAKGHHFKRLTLVVMLDLDLGFYSPDFRAIERLGQLITQVSGRAGRESLAGTVLMQTHLPQQELLLTLIKSGFKKFSQQLLRQREQAMLPPFSFQALIKVVHKKSEQAYEMTKGVVQDFPTSPHLLVLGPAPSILERKGGLYQWHLALLSPHRELLSKALSMAEKHFAKNKKRFGNIRMFIDVDPLILD